MLENNIWQPYQSEGVMVVSFDVGSQSLANATNWKDTHNLTHPVGYDLGYIVWGMYGEGYVPHNVLLAQDLTVLHSDSGFDQTAIINMIEAELDKAPTKPTGFQIINETNNTIELGWNHNPEADVVGYRINYNEIVKGSKATIDVGYTNQYTIMGLTTDTIYELTLEAYDQRQAQPAIPTDPLYAETQGDCVNNPSVDVTPNGPFHVCLDTDIILTANVTGGTGPFTYQWVEDNTEIPGATGTTYTASSAEKHLFNCSVSGNGCTNDNHDVQRVEITWQVAPDFDGIVSVTDGQQDICTLDLAWDPATSQCPGPFEYNIYRDTTSPVSTIPANLIDTVVSATTYSDSYNLNFGTNYYYVVRARDQITGGEDSNVIESSGSPNGPGGGPTALYAYDFENVVEWANWSVTTGPGQHTCGDWFRTDSSNQRPPDSEGYYALSDSDDCGPGSWTSTILTSPSFDCATLDLTTITLECDIYYRYYNGGDTATVEVYNGMFWNTVWTDPNSSTEEHLSIDVSSHLINVPNARIRFNYQNANYDYWFAVDNVEIIGYVYSPCTTSTQVPAISPLAMLGLIISLSIIIMIMKRKKTGAALN